MFVHPGVIVIQEKCGESMSAEEAAKHGLDLCCLKFSKVHYLGYIIRNYHCDEYIEFLKDKTKDRVTFKVGSKLRDKDFNFFDKYNVFKKLPYQLYINLHGDFDIVYGDEPKKNIKNTYNNPFWEDYKDIWTYDKEFKLFPKTNFSFCHITLLDVDLSDVEVKVLHLQNKCGTVPQTFKDVLNGENFVILSGKNFRFNGKNYDEYSCNDGTNESFSHAQYFTNVTDFDLYTESYVGAVLIKKKS